MALLDDFGKKISQASQSTLQKTRDMADVAKMNMQITDEEKRINDTYLEIGKKYVELHAADSEEAISDLVQIIADSNRKIGEIKAQIQEIKGVVRCDNCGAEVGRESAFCPACGNKMPEIVQTVVEQPATEEKKFCANCGATLENGALFCSECGTKIE